MNGVEWTRHRGSHLLQSLALLGAMAALLAALGWILAGPDGLVMAMILLLLLSVLSPNLPAGLMLRLLWARPMPPQLLARLQPLLKHLAMRAELPAVPRLFLLPGAAPNALTFGRRDDAWLGLTEGLLLGLERRELVGVLAHEISHIRNNDLWIMELAGLFQRLAGILALAGALMLLLGLPLLVLGQLHINWAAVALLLLAPTLVTLMQLGLSRVREFDADLEAVRLTGDPLGLASALRRIEQFESHWLRRLLLPGLRAPGQDLLRSHPATGSRIERLLSLLPAPASTPFAMPGSDRWSGPARRPGQRRPSGFRHL